MDEIIKIARLVLLWMIAATCWFIWMDLTSRAIVTLTEYPYGKSLAITVILFIITTLTVVSLLGEYNEK